MIKRWFTGSSGSHNSGRQPLGVAVLASPFGLQKLMYEQGPNLEEIGLALSGIGVAALHVTSSRESKSQSLLSTNRFEESSTSKTFKILTIASEIM